LDSFVIYICLEGRVCIEIIAGPEWIEKGETILIPASIEGVVLNPISGYAKLLEVYIAE